MNPNSTAPQSAEILLTKARHPVGFGVKRSCPFDFVPQPQLGCDPPSSLVERQRS